MRRGFTTIEVLVALLVLLVGVLAALSAATAAARAWIAAAHAERAVALAEAVADSLLGSPEILAGYREVGSFLLRWQSDAADASAFRIHVRYPTGGVPRWLTFHGKRASYRRGRR